MPRTVLVCLGDEKVARRMEKVLVAAGFVVVLAEKADPGFDFEEPPDLAAALDLLADGMEI